MKAIIKIAENTWEITESMDRILESEEFIEIDDGEKIRDKIREKLHEATGKIVIGDAFGLNRLITLDGVVVTNEQEFKDATAGTDIYVYAVNSVMLQPFYTNNIWEKTHTYYHKLVTDPKKIKKKQAQKKRAEAKKKQQPVNGNDLRNFKYNLMNIAGISHIGAATIKPGHITIAIVTAMLTDKTKAKEIIKAFAPQFLSKLEITKANLLAKGWANERDLKLLTRACQKATN